MMSWYMFRVQIVLFTAIISALSMIRKVIARISMNAQYQIGVGFIRHVKTQTDRMNVAAVQALLKYLKILYSVKI